MRFHPRDPRAPARSIYPELSNYHCDRGDYPRGTYKIFSRRRDRGNCIPSCYEHCSGLHEEGRYRHICRRKIFYSRATDEDGRPLALDLSAAQGAVLIGWTGSLIGPYVTANWMARVISCRLVTSEVVTLETGVTPSSDSVHYLLFRLVDITKIASRNVSG